ncbi:MAG: hypothetical protein RR090_07070 [Niameybacter sp.]
MRGILDDYYYEGDDLGLSYSETESTFKVWAPTAKQVVLYTYLDGGNYNVETGLVEDHSKGKPNPMVRGEQGVWQTTISANLEGQFYMYQVTFPDGKVEYAVDPYARATSANGQWTAIVDLSKTNPSGWQQDEGPELVSQADAILSLYQVTTIEQPKRATLVMDLDVEMKLHQNVRWYVSISKTL